MRQIGNKDRRVPFGRPCGGKDPVEGTGGNEPFLGFKLADLGEPNTRPDNDQVVQPDTRFDSLFPINGNKAVGLDLITDLYYTFMYPSSTGQMRYSNDRSRTIPLNVHGLDLLDFAHPTADIINKKVSKSKDGNLGVYKQDRIREARSRIEQRVEP